MQLARYKTAERFRNFGILQQHLRWACDCAAASFSLKPVIPAEPGTVQEYSHHILLRLPKPAGQNEQHTEIWWPPKLEKHPAVQAAYSALAEQRQHIDGLVKITAYEHWPGQSTRLAADHADLLYFPSGSMYEGVPFRTLSQTIGSLVRATPGVDSKEGEQDFQGVGIFVCTHGQRDARCGFHGTEIARIFKERLKGIEEVDVYQVSHVGGHKYAGNVLVYGSISPCDGDWFGGITADNASDFIQAFIDCPIGSNGGAEHAALRPFWRGRMGLSKEEQLALFADPGFASDSSEEGESEEGSDNDGSSSSSSSDNDK